MDYEECWNKCWALGHTSIDFVPRLTIEYDLYISPRKKLVAYWQSLVHKMEVCSIELYSTRDGKPYTMQQWMTRDMNDFRCAFFEMHCRNPVEHRKLFWKKLLVWTCGDKFGLNSFIKNLSFVRQIDRTWMLTIFLVSKLRHFST